MLKAISTVIFSIFLLSSTTFLFAQKPRLNQDSKLNNLVHPTGYKTGKLSELGRVKKVGEGSLVWSDTTSVGLFTGSRRRVSETALERSNSCFVAVLEMA